MRIAMKKHIYWKLVITFASLAVLLNIIAFSKSFCDAYTDNFYPIISDGLGRLNDLFPFSIGEGLLYLGIALVPVSVIILILLFIFRKRNGMRRFSKIYYKSLLMAITVTVFMYSVTWTVPVRGSLLGMDASPLVKMESDDILTIRNHLAEGLNKLAWELPRDEDKRLIFPTDKELEEGVKQGMKALSDEYPRLSGYYPTYKAAACSDVLDWMSIGGFTIPVTMEVTVNKYTMADRLYGPVLFAHESAHHQGYYKESEGKFLSFIGCMRSDNAFVRYSGLIEAFCEIDSAYAAAVSDTPSDQLPARIAVDDIVFEDITGEYEKSQEVYAEDDHPLEVFENTAVNVSDIGWETQGKILKEYNYEGSTALLLRYFKEKLGS